MNTYVGITPTGVVIVKANKMVEAVELMSGHAVRTIHVIPLKLATVWLVGEPAHNTTEVQRI